MILDGKMPNRIILTKNGLKMKDGTDLNAYLAQELGTKKREVVIMFRDDAQELLDWYNYSRAC